MPDAVVLYRLAQAEKRLEEQADHIEAIEARWAAREEERTKEERNRLIWGIGALGSVISILVGIIWSYRSVIFRGTGP